MNYSSYFEMGGLEVPVGSRNQPQVFSGSQCPTTIRFGRVHGTQPAVGEVEFDDLVGWNLGEVSTLTVGGATFVGMVVKGVVKVNIREGYTTNISMVDMRDRLHDKNIFGAFNMLDDQGRYYHITPRNWLKQTKTFIFSLGRQEMEAPKEGGLANLTNCNYKTISVAQLIESLSIDFGFTWSADSTAKNIMATTKPDNIDWNNGVKVIDAMSQLLSRCALQMTFWGNLHMHVTLRGITEDTFINQLVSGGATNICQIPNAIDGSIGTELNERGRRVLLIGSHNKYEHRFACHPDWNQEWTWDMVFNTMSLTALLKENNCTLLSRLEQLPEKWREKGDALWNGQPRNKMKIAEYLQSIPYRIYEVDFGRPVDDDLGFQPTVGLEYGGTDNSTRTHSRYPIADKLITHTDIRHQAIVGMRVHHYRGTYSSFDIDQTKRVPASDSQIDVEEVISKQNCEVSYKVRVSFGAVRFATNDSVAITDSGYITPENVVVRICVDKEFYTWVQGEQGTGARTRELRRTVSSLCKGFVDETEVPILSQTFADQGMEYTVKADDLAPLIAQKMLFHEAINTAGNIHFDECAGYMADGVVDSVSCSFSAESGLEENLNLTTGILDFDNLPIVRQAEFGTKNKSFFKGEKELADDLLAAQGAAMLKTAKGLAGLAAFVENVGKAGGVLNPPGFMNAFGAVGQVLATLPKAIYTAKSLFAHQPIVVKKPADTAPEGQP